MTVIIDGGAGVTYPDNVQQSRALTNTGGVPAYYAARAWVVFDGSTTPPTILAGSNVASVANVSTGVFTVTFTNSMPNTYYVVSGTMQNNTSSGGDRAGCVSTDPSPAPTATSFRIRVTDISGSSSNPVTANYNSPRVSLVVFA